MRTSASFATLVAIVTLVISFASAASEPAPAVQQIRTFYAALLSTMKEGAALNAHGRYETLKPTVDKVFNFEVQMAFASGPAWSTFSETQKKALIAAFARMTIATYAKNFSSFDGEKFIVDPTPITHGTDQIVRTKIVDSKGNAVPIDYRMRESDGEWKILDVYLNGAISQLALHRSDYAATIAKDGAAGLVKKISALSAKLMSEQNSDS